MQNKLPIQRLQRDRSGSGGRRTGRACNPCRERKTKCDGSKPTCSQCRVLGVADCFYPESIIIRLQKELELVRGKSESYEELLRNISEELEGPIAKRIAKVLKSPPCRSTEQQRRPSNASSSSSLGSLEEIDIVHEDLNRNPMSRATGYMGKNSEVTWMQRLDFEATKQGAHENSSEMATNLVPSDEPISLLNYHLDYQNLSEPAMTNAYDLPPKALANRLFQIYLDKVQISLPLIRQDLFLDQYDRFYSGNARNPGNKWLAIFNLIMAISSVFSRLSLQDTQQVVNETIFFSRAKMLNISDTIVYEHDDLQQVQVEALMAFFFLIVSQVNRSWKMIGIASRSGIALGINLYKRNDRLDTKSGEARTNLWWVVVRLEHLLSVMTGRASCLGDASSSAPPPNLLSSLPYVGPYIHERMNEPSLQIEDLQWTIYLNREQMETQGNLLKSITPSPSLYFFYVIDLSLITHAITNRVYATDISRAGRGSVESRISLYSKKMDWWAATLHPSFSFPNNEHDHLPGIKSSFQISLALNYYSTQIILNRPCLNRPAFEKESGTRLARSRFSNVSALACLRASLAVMTLLPEQPNLTWCYEALQWWDLLHILTQATVILLLEISIGPAPTRPGEAAVRAESTEVVLNGVKRGLSWLHCLGRTSEAARRAFGFCNSCIHRMATTKDLDLKGIPSSTSPYRTFRDTPQADKVNAQREAQPVSFPEDAKPADYLSFFHSGESDGILFQDLQGRHSPIYGLRTALAVDYSDYDMSQLSSHPANNTNADMEEILLSMMGPEE